MNYTTENNIIGYIISVQNPARMVINVSGRDILSGLEICLNCQTL